MLSSSWDGFFKRAILESGLDEGHTPQGHPRPSKRGRTGELSHGSREVGLMKRSADHSTATFIGSGSGIHFVRAVYNALASEQEKGTTSSTPRFRESDVVPGEDEQLPGTATHSGKARLWQSHEVASGPGRSNALDYDKLLVWSESYWTNWHSMFPFLFAPDVLLWFESIVASGSQNPFRHLSGFKVAIVRAVFSIALADRRQDSTSQTRQIVPACLVFESFEYAINSVQRALVDHPSMEAVQAGVAVQLFLVSMLRQSSAARLGGLIHSMIYQLGLHRCPVRYPTFSDHEVSMRKRLLWSVYCLDRHVSQSLGSPLGLRDDDLDVCFLHAESHADGSSLASNLDDRLALLNLVARIYKVKGQILEYCNKSINHRLTDHHDTAVLLSSEIAKVSNAIDELLDNKPKADSLPEIHVTSLKILKQECVISLNRPLLAHAKQESNYKAGLQVCVGASRAIITTLHHHSQQLSDGSAVTAPLLFPSFTWAVWMSAFIVVYAAVEGEMPLATTKLLANRGIDVLKALSLRGSFWPGACAAAIRDLLDRLELAQRNADKSGHASAALSRSMNPETTMVFPTTSTRPGAAPNPDDIFGGFGKSTAPTCNEEKCSSISEGGDPDADGASTSARDGLSAPGGFQGVLGLDAWASLMNGAPGLQHPATLATADQESVPNLFEGFEIPFWMSEDALHMDWLGNT